MTIKLSSKGQIVLPAKVRRQLALNVGDALNVSIEHLKGLDRIVISRTAPRRGKMKITIDPITKLPLIKLPPGSPKITSAMVKEMLADFP